MGRFRTTVYVDAEAKNRLEALSRETGIPEARLWREALDLLLRERGRASSADVASGLRSLERLGRELDIGSAYEAYRREERDLEAKKRR